MGTADGSDFETYVDARWPDLVAGLEEDGVAPDDARLAVAQTLVAARRSWRRRVREEQVDVTLWAEARERAALAPRPGEPAPHGLGPRDPGDGPERWLERAERVRAARRRLAARRALAGVAVAAVLAAGWAWWAARPAPPPVREEANPLPVAWYAEGELHLADVVVRLRGVEAFVADGSAVVARLRSGEVLRVDAEGGVEPVEEAPAALDDVPVPPPVVALGPYDVLVQSVPMADGGWAHLIDSSRRDGAQDAVRQSESGRRALVVCRTPTACGEPVTVVAGGTILLR
ncbi:hypothetical protein [Nocardioides sp. zg-1228]|uniref:hypothetical protein n=1 Tax=Nocardioides sp. zg-1228 TaxID=2763008 RepID=UPI001642FC6A|nr:hypothetical protein [Nocardioides sp. zg-1228]MBC2934318.1 hypothetical protein [Nocardioides sp. zg-1228]QSF59097.1 hypothetical protein JX575_07995 [Nocardioides sp. zg-1228]